MNPDIPLQLLGGITAREFLRDYWQKKTAVDPSGDS